MVANEAFGSGLAGVLDGARVLALLVDALLVRRALRVVGALDVVARHVGVSVQSDRAGAHGLVSDALTLGVASAGEAVGAAHGGTLAQAAGVSGLTLGV